MEEFGWQVKGSAKSAASLYSEQTNCETGGEAERQTSRQLRNDADRGRRKTGEGNGQQIRQPKQTPGTRMNMQSDKGSDGYSDRDKRERRLTGVGTRQEDRHVKSDEAASRKTGGHRAGTSKDWQTCRNQKWTSRQPSSRESDKGSTCCQVRFWSGFIDF
ncbi:hypothetical protein ABVT39_027041 [Epinephelus coioides]